MANKRMFSMDIVGSDHFLDMAASTQCLYFQLGMYADDDGFVQPKKVMRLLGSSDDELSVLKLKRFILSFENGVVVIKHWRMNNNKIDADRYKATTYSDEFSTLYIKENKAYTLDETQCAHPVHISGTQSRVEQSRVEQSRTTSSSEEGFVDFWGSYPKKVGRGHALRAWKKIKPSSELRGRIIQSIVDHKNSDQWMKENGQFIPNPATYLNQGRWDDEIIKTTGTAYKF